MNPINDQQTANEPERGPEETQLDTEDLGKVAAGGQPKAFMAVFD